MSEAVATRAPEVAIVGLGVIGGSVALRLRERGTPVRAFTTSTVDRTLATQAGVPVAASLGEAVRDVGLVLLAVPLDAVAEVAGDVLRDAPAKATILHAGSLQRPAAVGVAADVTARVIGTHPLAGSHRTGFHGASSELFRGAVVFAERRAKPRQRDDLELLWSLAGAGRIEYCDAETHDEAMAWMSHLPQLASTVLATTIAAAPLEPTGQLSLGPGARDVTRLAMSSLEMWRPILDRAPPATIAALRAYETRLAAVRKALEARDAAAVGAAWERARRWRSAFDSGETS